MVYYDKTRAAVYSISRTGSKFFIPSMIASTLAAIGCCFHVIAFFYAGRSLDNDLELLTTPTRAIAAIKNIAEMAECAK